MNVIMNGMRLSLVLFDTDYFYGVLPGCDKFSQFSAFINYMFYYSVISILNSFKILTAYSWNLGLPISSATRLVSAHLLRQPFYFFGLTH